MPHAALTDDMAIGYAPVELYEHRAAVMEMICAGTCFTTMLCFSLANKFRSHRLYDSEGLQASCRVAARGDVTYFPRPWVDLLQQLQQQDAADPDSSVDLPRAGPELSHFVSVLLNTSDETDSKNSMAKFLHQTLVRRHAVIDLIEKARERGHRAYRHVN